MYEFLENLPGEMSRLYMFNDLGFIQTQRNLCSSPSPGLTPVPDSFAISSDVGCLLADVPH